MNSQTCKLAVAALLATLAIAIAGCHFTQSALPADAGSSCASSLTPTEFNSWFDSNAVTLNGSVKPANSVTFPNIPNCSFYKWSEQMFLWLTSPAPPRYGGGGGLVMNSNAFFDVSLPDSSGRHFVPHTNGAIRAFNLRTAQRGILDLPIILEKRTLRMLEIIPPVFGPSGKQLVSDGDGNEVEVANVRRQDNGSPILLGVDGNPIKSPRAILRSKRDQKPKLFEDKLNKLEAFDKKELVQKITFNGKDFVLIDLFGNFPETEQGQADGGVLMAQNGSLVYYALTVKNVMALYRTMQGATVPAGTKFPISQTDLNAITAFASAHGQGPVIDSEALAIELKSSWVEAQGLPDADKFIQMKAIVPKYDKTNPNDWVPNGTQTVTLAMVGMHIVGSTVGHSEMLWATFEHLSNDPAAAYTYNVSGGGSTTIPQNTAGTWVFCGNGSTGPFNEMRMMMGGPSGDHIVANSPFNISPSNVLRTMPFGLPGSNANGNAEVISINQTVRSLLDPADIRKNYFHEGTTWTIGGASPTGGNQVGTNKLENSTLETFFQGNNCFSCHTSNTTTVSHVFNDTAPLF
jgi:hypothetical protein